MKWFTKIFGGGKGIIGEVADVVDRFVDTKEDKREFFKEVYQMQADEKANARDMYGKDSTIQKIYAVVFLLGYLGLTGWLIYAIISEQIATINQFETGLIGTIWGGMSAKINTVVDFFFGASESREPNASSLIKAKDKK